ncbi:Mas-related G-protein coupled receptor member D [Bacillus haynesii]|uniref:Mas-related G-protein coupled receptor member D n=1 Tax=Bacillus haynesii TaxID=1925021 RepID=UPI0022813727|nr:Mas-related G-protein coupled receptor member D [Bacillus haynesii]MCY7815070.1 Mas-related G-protein coupled receptor member D [Bacillus haynesii]MCY8224445.1 Mas-related G-protein coupled receptor member D [Bacillus haynesii]MCY8241168.1 Mas-related G-protein coupled receptor member D [Bacillus haynesii]MCY8371332.1 Mas-related G-protein coupled receptor member D [Bacillus haynesii]MCY8567315.1 Mas-related G-protein coupled receptor member D [Bacillus haynesii]
MEQIVFIVSMLALGATLVTFFGLILNDGLKGVFDLSRKPVKFMAGTFLLYIVTFAVYILINGH